MIGRPRSVMFTGPSAAARLMRPGSRLNARLVKVGMLMPNPACPSIQTLEVRQATSIGRRALGNRPCSGSMRPDGAGQLARTITSTRLAPPDRIPASIAGAMSAARVTRRDGTPMEVASAR